VNLRSGPIVDVLSIRYKDPYNEDEAFIAEAVENNAAIPKRKNSKNPIKGLASSTSAYSLAFTSSLTDIP